MPLLLILAGAGIVGAICKTLAEDLLAEGCVGSEYPKALPPSGHEEDQQDWDHEIASPEDPNPEVGEFPINALRNPPVLEYKPAPYGDDMQALLDRLAGLEDKINSMSERASGRAFAGPQDTPQAFPQQTPQERITDPSGGIEWEGGNPIAAFAKEGYGGHQLPDGLTYEANNPNHDALARSRVFKLLDNGVTTQGSIIYQTWGIHASGSSKEYKRAKNLYDRWLAEWQLQQERLKLEGVFNDQ